MLLKGISLALFGIGIFVLMQIISPLIAFKVWEITQYDASSLLADPLSFNGSFGGAKGLLSPDGQVLGVHINNVDNFPAFISTNAVNPPYPMFKLSIPKLKIDRLSVKVASNSFDNTLAQLPGTALPGEKGNIFVSGHSSIAQELASKGAKAYFSRLVDLKKSDEIVTEAVGQKYVYQVVGTKIVDPQDTKVINPPDYDGRYLTLMTCVPPGFNSKRLIVLAKLKQN